MSFSRPENSHPDMIDRPLGELPILAKYPLDYPSDTCFITPYREPIRVAWWNERFEEDEKETEEFNSRIRSEYLKCQAWTARTYNPKKV